MPNPTSSPRVLPARPSLEQLKKQAKQRLDQLRQAEPAAKLAEAQFAIAREHGFSSWRELKAAIDATPPDPVGDWIGELSPEARIGLHVRRTERGGLKASIDNRDYGLFDSPVDRIVVQGDRLTMTVVAPPPSRAVEGLYEAAWEAKTGRWVGAWTANGVALPLSFARGVYPPAATIEGLDGVWDGLVEMGGSYRVSFRVRSDDNGTFAWCDSPDRSGNGMPVSSLIRQERQVTFALKTVKVTGELSEDGRQIEGWFLRGDRAIPVVLTRRPPGAAGLFEPRREAIEVPAEALAAYAGAYDFAPGLTLTLTAGEGRLLAQLTGQPALELSPASTTEFFWPGGDYTAIFEVGADGRPDGVILRQHGRESWAMRRA